MALTATRRAFRSAVLAPLTMFLAASAWSQSSSSSFVVFATPREPTSGVSLVERADYVSFIVAVASSEPDLASRVQLLVERRNAVTEALAKQRVRFEAGPTYLALDQPTGPTFNPGSSLGYNRPNEAIVQVFVPLEKSGGNAFEAASRVAASLTKVQLPPRVSLRYFPFRLAVENPERYRKELITKVADEVAMIKAAMRSTGKVNVSGLASPIQARQVNDTDVELSIAYAVSIELP